MSIPSSVSNNKALLLLKNFGELNNQFTFNDLQKSLDSLMDPLISKSLENANQAFKKFVNDKEQQKAFLQNSPSANQWRMIFAIYPSFRQTSLEGIFRAAIQAAPGCSEEDSQQIYTRLIEKPETDLHQIYTQRYSAEFLAWIQNEIYALPSDSILLLLKIWQNFDQSIDQMWKVLLTLPSLSSSHTKELEIFQAKHSFMYKHHKSLQIIKLDTTSTVENAQIPTPARIPIRKYLNQYILLTKALSILLGEVGESYGFCAVGFKKGSWEYQLLNTPREISLKILTWRAKNIFPLYQEKLQPLIGFFEEKIKSLTKDLKEARQKVAQLEYILEQVQQGIPIYGNPNVQGTKKVSVSKIDETNNKRISEEQIKTYLENWKKIEKSLQTEAYRFSKRYCSY